MSNDLLREFNEELKCNDPELTNIIDSFTTKQVLKKSILSDKERYIVTIASLVANESTLLYKDMLNVFLEVLTPVEIKEVLYQSIVYVGLAKVYPFLDITNRVLDENNVELPLDGQTTVKYEDRLESGYNL